MLNHDAIRTLQPSAKQRKLFDEKWLYLLVIPGGRRLWRLKYYFPPRAPSQILVEDRDIHVIRSSHSRERRHPLRQA
jgi:hypothetical protein